jgi:hypothetical protein
VNVSVNTTGLTVTSRRSGRHVVVRPRTPEVESALASARLVVSADGDGLLSFVRQSVPLSEPIGSDSLVVPAGLELVVRLACRNGGHRFASLGGLATKPLQPIRGDWLDPGLLRFIREFDGGVIRYRNNKVDPAVLVAQTARAWPQHSIAVVCSGIPEGRRVRDVLRAHGVPSLAVNNQNRPGFVVGPGGELAPEVGRVVVTTPAYTVADGMDFGRRDLVFVVDPQVVWNRASSDCLDRARTARVYGFVPLDALPLAPWESDKLYENYGFHTVTIPAHGRVERQVVVCREAIFGGLPRNASVGTDLDRQLTEGPGPRNRWAAKVAKKAAEDGDAYLLVDNIAHALVLAEELPESGIESDGQVNTAGLSRAQRATLARAQNPSGPWLQPLIITTSALVNRDISRVSTLICALGGSGLPPLTIDQLTVPFGSPPLRIIDLDDRRTPGLGRDARRRHKLYRQREWFGPGQDPATARAEHFLATRPNGAVRP